MTQNTSSRAQPRLLDQLRTALRLRHYSPRTEESYLGWVKRFILFHGKRHPAEMAEPDVAAYLTHLAERNHVSASTQNQALSGLLFLYRHVLGRPLGPIAGLVWAKRERPLPVVLSRDEVATLLQALEGTPYLIALLLYGAGLRLSECLELRVKDLDSDRGQICIRSPKGGRDRMVPFPVVARALLAQHLVDVRRTHARDLAAGLGRVALPTAIAEKYPNAATEWRWQFVFPAGRICRDPRWGPANRYHLHESVVQRAIAEAGRRAALDKRVSCHTLRHHADSRIMPSTRSTAVGSAPDDALSLVRSA